MSSVKEQNECVRRLHEITAPEFSVADNDDAAKENSIVVTGTSLTSVPNAAELEDLKQSLLEKESQLLVMESLCLRESERQVELEDSVIAWQDKYDRLYESHKRVQKVNQSLEDKLLKMVDRNTGERAQLTSDVATLSVRLAQANFNIAKLQREIERYKADINLAIQLLQCKPESFMPQKISALPIDIQAKVSSYMRLETNSHSDSEGSGVGMVTTTSYKVLPASESPPPAPCPFPPTAMVYSMRGLDDKSNMHASSSHGNGKNTFSSKDSASNNNSNNNKNNNSGSDNNSSSYNNKNSANFQCSDPDLISPLIMAKFLEHELKADEVKHCDTCRCTKQDLTVLADESRFYTVATQTPYHNTNNNIGVGGGNLNDSLGEQLCLRCHSNLNSPSRTNSPYLMKIVKSSDSMISETKSSVSDLNDMDKLFTPPSKKDDLMVNPILGHHRLCDRTTGGLGCTTTAAMCHSAHVPDIGTMKASIAPGTMLYPTTHLGTYEAEKYLLETSTLAGLKGHGYLRNCVTANNNGYQRRFLDGGGTALELLNNVEPQHNKRDVMLEANDRCNPALEEEKPLLCASVAEEIKLNMTKKADELMHETIKSPTSTCSTRNLHEKSALAKSAISGSTNSLWSRTSNCESAKMFENFNRNLIRAIKSENPRHRGPRLCAMRIQRTENGQSNILLDNTESLETVTPVIYKRRERLLDEELDDNKDIITSGSPATASVQTSLAAAMTTSAEAVESIAITDCGSMYINNSWVNSADSPAPRPENVGEYSTARKTTLDESSPDGSNKMQLFCEADTNAVTDEISNCRLTQGIVAAVAHDTSEVNFSIPSKSTSKPSAPNYGMMLNGSCSKNSINSKSCTQSSSISEPIDFQESVILRRQQLSRVAEWVQNNTQQLEQQQQKQEHQVANAITSNCESSGTDRQSSFSTLDQLDSVSIEKLSMDSGYKTTPQAQANGFAGNRNDSNINQFTEISLSPKTNTSSSHNHCNGNVNNNNHAGDHNKDDDANYSQNELNSTAHTHYRRTTRSGLPVAWAAIVAASPESVQPDSNGNTKLTNDQSMSIMSPQQPTCDILNYKYYPSERDKTRAIDAELHLSTTNVDIAQMEYNVKQFLLKQNEWSMRSGGGRSISQSHTVAVTPSATASAVASVISVAQKPKGIRRSKLFTVAGIGPGVGERVRTAPSASASISTNPSESMTVTPTPAAMLRPKIPQRTETNL